MIIETIYFVSFLLCTYFHVEMSLFKPVSFTNMSGKRYRLQIMKLRHANSDWWMQGNELVINRGLSSDSEVSNDNALFDALYKSETTNEQESGLISSLSVSNFL